MAASKALAAWQEPGTWPGPAGCSVSATGTALVYQADEPGGLAAALLAD